MAAEELDLRQQLEQAFSAAREDPPEKPETPPVAEAVPAPAGDERPRDERGRFVSGLEKPQEEPAAPASAPDPKAAAPATPAAPDPKAAAPAAQPAAPTAAAPPNGWSAEAKAKWHELPAEIQAAVAKRETDIAKFTGKTDEERSFGREMQRVVAPYLAQIQAEGGTPAGAVQSLLNTAYVLRNGSPEQKQQALIAVAQQFNIPIPNSDGSQTPDDVAALKQELAAVRGELQQIRQGSSQADQARIQADIDAFAADPSHPHFEEVKAVMGALMTSGSARTLQEAYDQACYARPDIRTTLQAQQRAAEEQKRRSEEKAKADAARAKAVSITGGPGSAAPTAPANRSLREELEANFRTASGAV